MQTASVLAIKSLHKSLHKLEWKCIATSGATQEIAQASSSDLQCYCCCRWWWSNFLFRFGHRHCRWWSNFLFGFEHHHQWWRLWIPRQVLAHFLSTKFCTLSKPPNGLFCRIDCYCCWIQVSAVVLFKTHIWILCRISIFVLRFKCTYSFWNYRFSHGVLPRKKNRIFLQKQSYADGSIASVGLLCKIATLTAQVCHVQQRMQVTELQHRQRIWHL